MMHDDAWYNVRKGDVSVTKQYTKREVAGLTKLGWYVELLALGAPNPEAQWTITIQETHGGMWRVLGTAKTTAQMEDVLDRIRKLVWACKATPVPVSNEK